MPKQTKSVFFRTLTSPVFLISLALLVLNDHLFKYQFHNYLTGKLSDFAGLLCFGLFWAALFPKQAKVVLLLVGCAFIYWKSENSISFINWINEHSFFHFTRVVDYGDLMALITLPYAFLNLQRVVNDQVKFRLKMTPVLPLLLACVAFVATSDEETDINCYGGSTYEVPFAEEEFIVKMEENFYTETLGFEPGSGFALLEYRTAICGDSLRAQATVKPTFITDSTSVFELFGICFECENYIEEELVLEDFEERVVNVLLAN